MNANAALTTLKSGRSLVSELAPSSPEYRSWVGVYHLAADSKCVHNLLRNNRLSTISPDADIYRIRVFEVRRDLMAGDRWLSEGDLVSKQNLFANGLEDLVTKLRTLGLSLEDLCYPWDTDYPI